MLWSSRNRTGTVMATPFILVCLPAISPPRHLNHPCDSALSLSSTHYCIAFMMALVWLVVLPIPSQVQHTHLALTSEADAMRVSWVTGSSSHAPAIRFRGIASGAQEPMPETDVGSWQVRTVVVSQNVFLFLFYFFSYLIPGYVNILSDKSK